MGGSHQIPMVPHAIQVTNQLKVLMSSGQLVGGKLSTKCNDYYVSWSPIQELTALDIA